MFIRFIFLFLSIFSPLIPIRTGRAHRHVLWWYAWACMIFDLFFFALKFFKIEAYWSYNLFLLLEYVLVSYFFSRKIFKGTGLLIVRICMGFIGVYFVINTLSISVLHFNYEGGALLYGMFILFAIAGLYKVIKEIEQTRIERSPLFFISIAFLVLASGSFIVLLFEAELIKTNRQIVENLWAMLHNPLNIFKNILIGYALWLEGKATVPSKRENTAFQDVQNAKFPYV